MEYDIAEVLKRMMQFVGVKNQAELGTAIGVSQASISDAKRKGKIPPEWLIKLATERRMNPVWALSGEGSHDIRGLKSLMDDFNPAELVEQAISEINVHEGVMMTTKVLSSKTGYANALWHNLKSFDAAVDREAEVGEMKEMMAKLAEDNQKIMTELAEMKRVVAAPIEEAKKRDEAANS